MVRFSSLNVGVAPIGTVKPGEKFSKHLNMSIPAGVGKSGVRVVAFVQEQSSGRVIGVTQLKL